MMSWSTIYNHVVNVPVVVIPGVGVIYGLELVTVGETTGITNNYVTYIYETIR